MTTDSKIALAISGLIICFMFGWFAPFLWLLFIAGGVALLSIPTKKKKSVQQHTDTAVEDASLDYSGAQAQIEDLIRNETDEKVKQGLNKALLVVSANTYASPMYETERPQAVAVTQEELDEQKKRQELRNINTILYTASFLLVGAAALFIGFNDMAGPILKFMTVLIAAALLYCIGLTMHERSVRLVPAATAFIGTGLALIPFVGLALNSYIIHDAPLSWFITSLVGLAAFLAAVQQTRSSVMAYLSLGFLFSLATSSLSMLDAPFVWYFVAIIVTSSLLTYLGYKRPTSVPEYFTKPLELNTQVAVPAVLIGSLLLVSEFRAFEYAMIFGTSALHYLVMTLVDAGSKRFLQWTAARSLLVAFAASLTYHFTEDWQWVSGIVLASGVLAHMYSIYRLKHEPREQAWLWAAQGLVAVSMLGWIGSAVQVSIALGILLVVSGWQLYVVKRVEYALAAVLAAVILPLTILRGVVEPAVGLEIVAFVALGFAAALLLLRKFISKRRDAFRQAASIFYISFIAETIVLAAIAGDWPVFAVCMATAGILTYVASFVEREVTLVIGANIMLTIGVFTGYGQVFDSYTWVPLFTGATLGSIWYGLSWYHRKRWHLALSEHARSVTLVVSTISLLALAAFIAMFQSEDTIVAGVITGCLTAGIITYESHVRKRLVGFEVALYVATFSLQRLLAHVYPDADWLVYTHWWAFTGGLAALLYYKRTANKQNAIVRGVIALSLLSVPLGFAALIDSTSGYRTWFLLEHAILALAGLMLNRKLAVVWGAVCVGLSVLYMLRGYTYFLLTFIAIILIIFAVVRLSKKG